MMDEIKFVYCDYYKKLMVEDFSLNDNPEHLHYGKCAIIGRCTVEHGLYFLRNVCVTSLDPNFQLLDNELSVLLLPNVSNVGEGPPINQLVEVYGESLLFDKTMRFSCDVSTIPCTTSLDIYRTRRVAEETNGELHANYHSIIADTYVPAIKVHGIMPIENAHELINLNLRLKLIKRR